MHEIKLKEINKTVEMLLIFINYLILQGTAQRFELPALGRGRRSRPTGKMLGIAPESPASGARFVGQWQNKRIAA